jgi:hypothetical protein
LNFLELYQTAFARLEQRRGEAAGTHHFLCLTCLSSDVITAEGHHIGTRLDPQIEYFCANCHRRFTVPQIAHPKPTCDTPGPTERGGHYCLGLSLVLVPMARLVHHLAAELADLVENEKSMPEPAKILTLQLKHYLFTLSPFLDRSAQRLQHHGSALLQNVKNPRSEPSRRN